MSLDDTLPKPGEGVRGDGGGVPVRGRPNGASRSRRMKSELTHEKLRRATALLLEQKPLRELKVADITGLAAVSPSTFYIYFADVSEAVLAVLAEVYKDLPDFPGMIRGFARETLKEDVQAYVRSYLTFWDDHYAVLRLRNLAAEEGDVRFRASRDSAFQPMAAALAEKIAVFRGEELGEDDVPALAAAVVAIGALERLTAVIRMKPKGKEVTRAKLLDAATLMFRDMIEPR